MTQLETTQRANGRTTLGVVGSEKGRRWVLCAMATLHSGQRGVRGERGSGCGCGCGCVDSWCCYVLKFE
jgi:hypothetical protein